MADDGYYITTPIYYVNGDPHFAHAYTSVACDAFARFHRLDGRDVYFLTGTDEHGQKVERAARDAGQEPSAFCDAGSRKFEDMGRLMNISNDQFIRTTDASHRRAVEALWQRLEESGDIYEGTFEGWYSVRDEAFYEERELVDGKAPTGAPVEWVQEPNYFFRLSAWGERLLALYDANPGFIAPDTRRNEVVRFVKDGLRDLSISRSSFEWGIPVPGDKDQVIYVWLDALTNYISALGYPDTDTSLWRRFWPASVHVVGKDIIRFHCVYWPAFLMAAGLPVPKCVYAHGWWTVEGEKMSKSLDNFIPPEKLVTEFGVDAVRYFMLRELPFGNDGNWAREAILARTNGDLANGLGNLAQRILSLLSRHRNGTVPSPTTLTEEDAALIAEAKTLLPGLREDMADHAPHRALARLWALVANANRYVSDQQPWTLAATAPDRFDTVAWVTVEALRHIGILAQPFMPSTMENLLDQLGVDAHQRLFATLDDPLAPGAVLPPPAPVFRRIDQGGG